MGRYSLKGKPTQGGGETTNVRRARSGSSTNCYERNRDGAVRRGTLIRWINYVMYSDLGTIDLLRSLWGSGFKPDFKKEIWVNAWISTAFHNPLYS